MKILIGAIAAAALMSVAMAPAKAASFSCMELEGRAAAEVRVCNSRWLGALDERMDSWYRRALERAPREDGLRAGASFGRFHTPDRPPRFSMRRMSPMITDRSTALTMS